MNNPDIIIDKNVIEIIGKNEEYSVKFLNLLGTGKPIFGMPPMLLLEVLGFSFSTLSGIEIRKDETIQHKKKLDTEQKNNSKIFYDILKPLYDSKLVEINDVLVRNESIKIKNLRELFEKRKSDYSSTCGKYILMCCETLLNQDSLYETILEIFSINLLCTAQTNRNIKYFYESALMVFLNSKIEYDQQQYFSKLINHFVDGMITKKIEMHIEKQNEIKTFIEKNRNWRLKIIEDQFDSELLDIFFFGINGEEEILNIYTTDSPDVLLFRLRIYKLILDEVSEIRLKSDLNAIRYRKDNKVIFLNKNIEKIDEISFNEII